MNDELNVACIADCLERIALYTSSGRAAFNQSTLIQDAVIRNFQVMGEATKNISEALKLAYSDVPWRRVAGFRDVLVHDYLRIDLDIVWNIIEVELPKLRPQILEILQALS